eukprot:4361199-Pleurochrysis_carterae.AAC.1
MVETPGFSQKTHEGAPATARGDNRQRELRRSAAREPINCDDEAGRRCGRAEVTRGRSTKRGGAKTIYRPRQPLPFAATRLRPYMRALTRARAPLACHGRTRRRCGVRRARLRSNVCSHRLSHPLRLARLVRLRALLHRGAHAQLAAQQWADDGRRRPEVAERKNQLAHQLHRMYTRTHGHARTHNHTRPMRRKSLVTRPAHSKSLRSAITNSGKK